MKGLPHDVTVTRAWKTKAEDEAAWWSRQALLGGASALWFFLGVFAGPDELAKWIFVGLAGGTSFATGVRLYYRRLARRLGKGLERAKHPETP